MRFWTARPSAKSEGMMNRKVLSKAVFPVLPVNSCDNQRVCGREHPRGPRPVSGIIDLYDAGA
jgi:hypothetical protein